MNKLLIATGNIGKFGEIAEVLRDLNFEILSLKDLDGEWDQVEETGETHDENAAFKARHFHGVSGFLTLGEDSGLEVDALKGELGLHTRRWGAGHDASDDEWLAYFLKRMDGVPDSERSARFVCSAVLKLSDGTEHLFKAQTNGFITHTQEAPILEGLSLSSVFRPSGFDCVYAALTKLEKAKISHRGLAVGKAKTFLEDYSVSLTSSSSFLS